MGPKRAANELLSTSCHQDYTYMGRGGMSLLPVCVIVNDATCIGNRYTFCTYTTQEAATLYNVISETRL